MTKKGRFDQIETEKRGEKEKKPLLARILFRRKLEIEGVDRDALPPPIPHPPVKKVVAHTTEPIVTQTYPVPEQPTRRAASSTSNVDTQTTKVELESIVLDIEAAERSKREGQTRRKTIQTQRQLEDIRKITLETAKSRVENARSTLIFWAVVVGGVGLLLYFLARSGVFQGRGSENFIYLILLIVLSVFRTRRWWM